jgi:hypothetical protein
MNWNQALGGPLEQPLLATAPARAKNQHMAAILPGQFFDPRDFVMG